MQISLPQRKNLQNRRPWHGLAFIMEALVLLLFLIVSVAVVMQVFSAARTHGDDANDLSEAVILASNEAELFAADPTAPGSTRYFSIANGALEEIGGAEEGAYAVTRDIQTDTLMRGTMYTAVISVARDGETLYMLSTKNYVSNGGGEADG